MKRLVTKPMITSMDEIKKDIEGIVSLHRGSFKDPDRFLRRLTRLLENEVAENMKEDVYTVEKTDFCTKYCKNGVPHREDGPAVIFKTGDRHWYQNGLLHRPQTEGPASDYYGGWKLYFEHGKYIRTDKV